MRVLLAVFVALLSCGADAQQAATGTGGSREAAVRRLLEVTGAGKQGVQVIDTLMDSFKKTFPSVPTTFWAEFRAEVRAEDLVEVCVPVYEKHLTEEEVRGILAFYETPVGKRLLEVQPLLIQESMLAGQEWGRNLAQKVINKLREKGYAPQATAGLDRAPAKELEVSPVGTDPGA